LKPAPTPRGRFITFEGIDGTGKSSAVQSVAHALRGDGADVVTTREETAGPTGEWVRRSIKEHWDPLATTFLFLADRALHVREIETWLAAGKTVLCDRFVDSTYAYQAATLAARVPRPMEFLRGLHANWCPVPDRVILLRCDPAVAVGRTKRRGQTTPYEEVRFLTQVQENYLALAAAEPKRFVVLDAGGSLEALKRDAVAASRAP
jgi:dTMP kinase